MFEVFKNYKIPKLRVLVAEDHSQMRSLLVGLLCIDFEVVGAVSDGEELVRSAACLCPDVIVSDIHMPRTDGPSAREKLGCVQPLAPFVFVSMMGKRDIKLLPIIDQPVAFVFKGELSDHLTHAVAAVFAGDGYLSPYYRDLP